MKFWWVPGNQHLILLQIQTPLVAKVVIAVLSRFAHLGGPPAGAAIFEDVLLTSNGYQMARFELPHGP